MTASTRPLVVVTGASSGIGAAFARRLASEGRDLLLVARREERLREQAARLAAEHGVAVEALPCDLSDPAAVASLVARLRALERPGGLYHCAGFGVTGPIGAADPRRLDDMAQVHVNATIALTSALVPGLREAGAGDVVIVSSIAGWLFGTGCATYCATKAFETSYARSMARELKGSGVRAMALCPGYTRSEFHDTPEYSDWDRRSVPAWLWDEPDQVVDAAMKSLARGRDACVPGLANKLVVFSMSTGVLGLLRERIRRRSPRMPPAPR